MSYLAIKSPAPTYKTNRRKCGWGSTLTTCDICGRIMVGHNRGICSRCKRSLVGDRPHKRVFNSSAVGAKAINRASFTQDKDELSFFDLMSESEGGAK